MVSLVEESGQVAAWDDVLLKLLVSNISNSEKWNAFLQLEKRVTKFLEKNSAEIVDEAVKNTKIGASITILYPAECNTYKKVIDSFANDYENVFLKYNNSLTITDSKNEPKQKKQVEEKVTIPYRIGWNKNGNTNFEDFFNDLITRGLITLANEKTNKQEIFKILREIFDVVKKSDPDKNKPGKSSHIKNSPQQLSQRLMWTGTLEDFCATFGELIHYKGETILFLNSKRGSATPTAKVLYIAFFIFKKVKNEKIQITNGALESALRKYSVKKK